MFASAEIRHLTEEVVASFGSGIRAVETVIANGLEILDRYRLEEEAVQGSLRERFAAVGSLRRKDFDGVMERILSFQSRREAEIKDLIRKFLSRQRGLVARLLAALKAGIAEEVERSKMELAAVVQEAKEEIEVFQREQGRIRETFARFETGQRQVSAHEFKRAIELLEIELLGSVSTAGRLRAVGET